VGRASPRRSGVVRDAGPRWCTAGLELVDDSGPPRSYRRAFGGFDIGRAAAYGDADVERLLSDAGIIRNRSKVVAAIANARAVLAIQQEGNSFDSDVWSFVGGRTLQHQFQRLQDIPPATEESEALSQDLRRRGFKFVGPTICYAFMQSAGLVNDHLVDCFRYQTLANVPPAR
jgi:DNA-3-methyladenine glycosylase I